VLLFHILIKAPHFQKSLR